MRRAAHQGHLLSQLVPAPGATLDEAALEALRERIRSWLRISAELTCVAELPPGPVLVDERDWS